MYQLENAKVKPVTRNGFWLDEDISTKLISQIFLDYKKAIFVLTNNYLPGTHYLDMEDIKPLPFLDDSLTLPAWFAAIGNLALPTTTTPPDFDPQLVKYGDAWKANYDIIKVSATYNPLVEVPESEKVDLLLQRADTDYELMGTRCLATVNGLLHLTESSEHGFHIRQGGKSAKYCNKTQVGLLSFNAIGDVQLLPMNRDMLVQPHPSIKLKEKIYFNLDMDLSNKTVMASIGGYLHTLDNIVRIGGITTIIIDWYKIPYAKRYFEQRRLMDMSDLGLSSNVNNPSQISIEEFYSDETIKRYLELSQSFFIIVDNNDMFAEFKIVESSKLPGTYYHNEEPVYPLQIGLGRLGNYWKVWDDQKWVLSVDENYLNYYNFETTSYLQENSIDDTRRTEKAVDYSDGYLILIGVS